MRSIISQIILIIGVCSVPLIAQSEEPDDAQWKALFESIPETESVEARFEEWRHSLLRDRPSYLQGVLRFDSKIGVSLNYFEPAERTIIITEDTVSLRN